MKTDRKSILDHLELIYDVDRECFDVLTDRQLIYIYHRIKHPEIMMMTLQELGDHFGSSRQAVDQLRKRGLRRLSQQECFQNMRAKHQ